MGTQNIQNNIDELSSERKELQAEITKLQKDLNNKKLDYQLNGNRTPRDVLISMRQEIHLKTQDLHNLDRKISDLRQDLRIAISRVENNSFKEAAKILLDSDMYSKVCSMSESLAQEIYASN